MKKKNFKFMEIVEIHSTGSDLDGQQGKIYGVSAVHILDSYIVVFDTPIWGIHPGTKEKIQYQSVSLIESCLDHPEAIEIRRMLKLKNPNL